MTEKNLYLDLANEEQSISIKLAIAAAAVCTCKEHHYNYTLSAVRVSIEKDGKITVDATDTAIAFVAEFTAKVIEGTPLPRAFLVPREIAAKVKPTQRVVFYGDEIRIIEGSNSIRPQAIEELREGMQYDADAHPWEELAPGYCPQAYYEKDGVTFFARAEPADCYFRDADRVTEETVRARIDELIEDALKDAAGVEGSRSAAQDAFFADPYRALHR